MSDMRHVYEIHYDMNWIYFNCDGWACWKWKL